MFQTIKRVVVLACCLTINYLIINTTAQTYSPLPFYEGFNSTWINKNNIRDVPSSFWTNTPATGENSWSRDDDGAAREAWLFSNGAYSPESARGTLHSARFHSKGCSTGSLGTLDLSLDFSSQSGNKTLTFSYINQDGIDIMDVYLSTDGGSTFGNSLLELETKTTWTKITIDLGNSMSSQCVLRFACRGDGGTSDIGLDEIRINSVEAEFSVDTLIGYAPFKVQVTDKSSGNPTNWQWDFNNDGQIDATVQNPGYSYQDTGIYTIKLVSYNTGSSDSIIKIKCVTVYGYASFPFFEGFENAWINRDDIRDVPSFYWKNTPATGTNSWSREDDGYKRGAWFNNIIFFYKGLRSNHAAAFNTYYTNESGSLDLYTNFSATTESKSLGFWYNMEGNDSLHIYLSTDNGKNFGYPLCSLGADSKNDKTFDNQWRKKVIDFDTVNASKGVIRFKATGDADSPIFGLDNVKLSAVAALYSADTIIGCAPFTVHFTDRSVGNPTSWKWDFNNDGIIDDTNQNPIHTFDTGGIYYVNLIVAKVGYVDSFLNAYPIKVSKYASLPFYENFDNWINWFDIVDVPSYYWKNTPCTGKNSWRREDQGLSADWGSYGYGLPFNKHSAMFNSMNTLESGTMDLLVDLSGASKNRILTFEYLNEADNDSLFVSLSADGADHFGNPIYQLGKQGYWSVKSVKLETVNSATGCIRFKARGGMQNYIMIDDVNVTYLKADFDAPRVIAGTYLNIPFTDKSQGSPSVWQWDFNNDGKIDATDQNPSYYYKDKGFYSVRLIVTNTETGLSDTIIKKNCINVGMPNDIESPDRINEMVSISPNPTDGLLNLQLDYAEDMKAVIHIFNIEGKLVYSKNFNSLQNQVVNICFLPSGIYTIKTICRDRININKIIKR